MAELEGYISEFQLTGNFAAEQNDFDQLPSNDQSGQASDNRHKEARFEDYLGEFRIARKLPPSQKESSPLPSIDDELDRASSDREDSPLPVPKYRQRAEARAIVYSLDVAAATDLSTHLYRAFRRKATASQSKTTIYKAWTAWPLPPEVVPRDEGKSVVEPPFIFVPDDPSRILFESLVACCLRIAKEQLQSRVMEDPSLQGKFQFLADEYRSEMMLGPSVRHVLTGLDSWLEALHKVRKSYASYDSTQSRKTPRTSSVEAGETEDSSRPPSPKKKRRRARSSDDDDFGGRSDDSVSRRPRKRVRRTSSTGESDASLSSRTRKFGLRNWQDVLALAEMSNLDQAAVAKAKERCSVLFESAGFGDDNGGDQV